MNVLRKISLLLYGLLIVVSSFHFHAPAFASNLTVDETKTVHNSPFHAFSECTLAPFRSNAAGYYNTNFILPDTNLIVTPIYQILLLKYGEHYTSQVNPRAPPIII